MYMGVPIIEVFTIFLFVSLLCLAAIEDVRDFRIPNRIVLALMALYPAYVLASSDPVLWWNGLLVAALCFVIGLLLYATGTVGGGDIKLIVAASLWAGTEYIFEFLIITGLAGGFLAMLLGSGLVRGLAIMADNAGNLDLRDKLLSRDLPYGVAIAAGGLFVGSRLLGA